MIPVANPRAGYLEHKQEIDEAILKVLDSGSYILGEEVRKFEKSFEDYIGVRHCVGVASGTDALYLSIRALGIGAGDEVITVSHTAVATISAIVMTGATPVLIDIKDDFTINPELIESAITDKTRAIIPVHLYGKSCEMVKIMKVARQYKLPVIEDCAQATGASYKGKRVGSIGTVGCFSFYPTKNLGCYGDGGAITTNSRTLVNRLRLLQQYGWEKRYVSKIHGYNSRLDEIQAAVLNVKLKYLDQDNQKRKNKAFSYGDRDWNIDHVYHLYVKRFKSRAVIRKQLKDKGIETGIHYPVPIHLQPGYKNLVRISGSMKVTERASKEVLSLPMYPQLEWQWCP